MSKDLTKGSTLKNLINFSLPYLLSCFLQTFYGLCDLFIAGQYNGSETITAISTGSQIMHMVTVIIVGLAMGSTVLISQFVGAGEKERAKKAIGNSVSLFMVVSVCLAVILLFLSNSIVKIMSVPTEAIAETKIYLTVCFIGIPFITSYNIISCIFRGTGDSKTPMYFIAIACIANIAIDFLLIGGLKMGALGAALGTVLSQTISVICALTCIIKKDLGLHIEKTDFAIDRKLIRQIAGIGIPVSLQDGFIQVSFLIITIIANSRGLVIAAAVGIVEKIIGFLFLIPSAMMSSISAIAAQNYGAGNKPRARQTFKLGVTICVAFGLLTGILFQFISEPVIDLFTDNSAVIRMGADYLHSYVFDCAAAGIHFCFSGLFCAYGKSIISFIHNIASIVLVRIPGAYLASVLYPDSLFEMGMAAPLGSLLSALICVFFYILYRRRGEI